MKKYEVPEMNISKFEVENILTESSSTPASVQEALETAGYKTGVQVTSASSWNAIF